MVSVIQFYNSCEEKMKLGSLKRNKHANVELKRL